MALISTKKSGFKKITFAHDLALRTYSVLSTDIDCLSLSLRRHNLGKSGTPEKSLRVDVLYGMFHFYPKIFVSE
jgi:hypothetical protein